MLLRRIFSTVLSQEKRYSLNYTKIVTIPALHILLFPVKHVSKKGSISFIVGSCNLSIVDREKCSSARVASTKCEEIGCCYDEWLQQCYKSEQRKRHLLFDLSSTISIGFCKM